MKSTTQSLNWLIILFVALGVAFGFTLNADAQNTKLVNGNYVAVKSSAATTSKPKDTGKTYTDTKGNVYPVYISVNGKLFIIRTSRNGNEYKQYLKVS